MGETIVIIIRNFIIFSVTMAISVGISVGLLDVLIAFQKQVFSVPETLFIAHDNYFVGILIGTVVFSALYILFWMGNDFKKKYLFVAIGILLIGTMAETYDFFKYTKINSEDIFVRDGPWYKEKRYEWNQVSRADLGYSFSSKGNFTGNYIVTFEDGKKVDLWPVNNSLLLLDSTLKAQNVNIYRQPINELTYSRIMAKSYDKPDGVNDLILKLFTYQCATDSQVVFSPNRISKAKVELTNIAAKTNSNSAPNSLIIPVIVDNDQSDFFYIFMGKTFLKIKDLKGNSLAEINLQTEKKYPGPIVITSDGEKVKLKLEDREVEIPGIKALVGNIQSIGVGVTTKWSLYSN